MKHIGGPICLAALLVLWVAVPLQAQEPGWSEPVSLSSDFPTCYLPDIAADQAGNLYVVWDVLFETREGLFSDGVAFAMWDGNSWSPETDIFGFELFHLPAVAVDSQGRLHVIGIGMDHRGQAYLGYSQTWAQQSPTDARAWSDPVDISGGYPEPYWNDIVMDSRDWIHVVFSDGSDHDGATEDGGCVGWDCSWVSYTRSTDGGESWSTPVKISPAMANGARVMITVDNDHNLYVVWSTQTTLPRGDIPAGRSANGFTYSLDGGQTWGEPEVQLFDTRYDHWLSIAVDSQQTIHIVAVGHALLHRYKEGLDRPWLEDTIPRWDAGDIYAGYGFRGVAVDSSDNLHFVLPTWYRESSQEPAGLFHSVWNRQRGWSDWARATTNARGKGCGLGNLVVSGGNRLNVVWFEHLERSSGHLFVPPRGRIEVYYASFQTGAQAVPSVPLPQASVPTAQTMSTPESTSTEARSSLEPNATSTPTPTRWSSSASDAEDTQTEKWVPNPLLVGLALAGALVGVVVVLKSATIGRQ